MPPEDARPEESPMETGAFRSFAPCPLPPHSGAFPSAQTPHARSRARDSPQPLGGILRDEASRHGAAQLHRSSFQPRKNRSPKRDRDLRGLLAPPQSRRCFDRAESGRLSCPSRAPTTPGTASPGSAALPASILAHLPLLAVPLLRAFWVLPHPPVRAPPAPRRASP